MQCVSIILFILSRSFKSSLYFYLNLFSYYITLSNSPFLISMLSIHVALSLCKSWCEVVNKPKTNYRLYLQNNSVRIPVSCTFNYHEFWVNNIQAEFKLCLSLQKHNHQRRPSVQNVSQIIFTNTFTNIIHETKNKKQRKHNGSFTVATCSMPGIRLVNTLPEFEKYIDGVGRFSFCSNCSLSGVTTNTCRCASFCVKGFRI